MSKQTREEKRADEARMIAQMQEAMAEKEKEKQAEAAPQNAQATPKKPKTIPCPRCKMQMEADGRCATCGFKKYVPMDEKKRNKIKLITTIVAMVIFVVLFVILQFKK